MKKYTNPEAKITNFDACDIITASGNFGTNGAVVSSDALVGASADMYEVYSKNSAAQNTNVSVFTW